MHVRVLQQYLLPLPLLLLLLVRHSVLLYSHHARAGSMNDCYHS
jgi:hypothetical protein